ncbi:MAG: DNA helicase RecQ [Bacteroidota bacterium]|nr:DNA helicase RecQ [Bacteroidota bacterium]
MHTSRHKAIKYLKNYFGYEQFRPLQEDIIEHVLNQNDAVVIMPTGGGKSICFQVPALILEGITVVVSPLISLMKDQVDALLGNGVKAAFLNSSLLPEDEQRITQQCKDGEIKLLYVSPERLMVERWGLLKSIPVSLFAIDEAHCISSWGHDFRPEYTKLGTLKQQFPQVPFIALTATADKVTRNDIIRQLRLSEPKIFIDSFDRPNLSLEVRTGLKNKQKLAEITDFINEREGEAGIIYCISRKSTEELAASLRKYGINAKHYHAGLSAEDRNNVQDDFIRDQTTVMCATVAFGMGIDKSNVRWVIHYNLPRNIESFYQEIGRAGRDGLNSDTLLFYNLSDLLILEKFARESALSELNVEKLKRIQQYAEANICRRKILLNYFGEIREENCNNCDVCRSPRKQFDGTVIVQKALSALSRMKQKAGSALLIDVLRGSLRAEIVEKGFDRIKTFGAGRDIGFMEWQQFIMQMLNLGILEMAYDDNFSLKITSLGNDILFGRKTAQLVVPVISHAKTSQPKEKPATSRELSDDELLFDALRQLRKTIAAEQNIPAYTVFNDATLRAMASEKPETDDDFLAIPGVGTAKLEHYGEEFMKIIAAHSSNDRQKKEKGSTYIKTFEFYQQGFTPEEIAHRRNLNPTTIYSHLAYLFQKGEAIDIGRYVTAHEIKEIEGARNSIGESDKLKDYYDHLGGTIDYFKIRLALVFLERKE